MYISSDIYKIDNDIIMSGYLLLVNIFITKFYLNILKISN